jgi:P27 family predicted phage terminase small subunit
MTKKISLISENQSPPPKALGREGMDLWRRLTGCYDISDEAGRSILWEACMAHQRAEEAAALIATEGLILRSRQGGGKENPLVKTELSLRGFVVRTLGKLGLGLEPVKNVGNPGYQGIGITGPWDK